MSDAGTARFYPRIVTLSLNEHDQKGLDVLKDALKRDSRTDVIRFLIWTALENNFPDEYKKLKEEDANGNGNRE